VRIEWTPAALASAARFMADQPGMRAINAAIIRLAGDPEPPEAFVRGSYRRLRAGVYRVMYAVEEDIITVLRVDRVISAR
jgi:mRNA-degrading endonuclease RelE of RelBE toxin-antitoxin system